MEGAEQRTKDKRACLRHVFGRFQQRYIFSLLGFLAVANSYTMRTCLNLTIVEMVEVPKDDNAKADPENYCPGKIPQAGHENVEGYRFDWNEKEQGYILSAFYFGYVITHLPGGVLAERYGGKQVCGLGLLLCGLLTLLSPVCARQSWQSLAFLRFLEGFTEGVMFPALNALIAHWSPLKERGRIGSVIFAGNQIGIVVSNVTTGLILKYSKGNWPIVFYFFGILCIIWYIFWHLLVYSTPKVHPFISDEEMNYIYEQITHEGITKKEHLPPEPWCKIFTSIPVWALVLGQVGHDWSLFLAQTELGKYMKTVLKFKIAKNGALGALPFLAMWITAIIGGIITDFVLKRGIMTIGVQRKVFATVASLGPGFGCVAASYAGCNKTLVMVLFTLGMATMGFYYSSLKLNPLDISPNYAGTTMAIVNGLGAIAGAIVPLATGAMIEDNTLSQWRKVFWISAVIIFVTNGLYIILGSSKIQSWNDPETSEDRQN